MPVSVPDEQNRREGRVMCGGFWIKCIVHLWRRRDLLNYVLLLHALYFVCVLKKIQVVSYPHASLGANHGNILASKLCFKSLGF